MLNSFATILRLQQQIGSGEANLQAIVDSALARLDEAAPLNAFLQLYADEVRTAVGRVESRIRSGRGGRLAAALVAVKDNIAIKGKPLTCGSRILANFISPYDATVVSRLKAEDAVILGKTNLDEFAMGSSNENSAFGPVLNPHDTSRVPGGSSGGSAVAVASGLCQVALGSDTGGSIRQPAAFCGVYGMKPTYGRVSRFGLVAFASSLDQIGAFARHVEDLALVLQVISGHDPRDSTSAGEPVPDYLSALDRIDFSGKTIGVPREYVTEEVQPEILRAVHSVADRFRQAGAQIVDISLPHTAYSIAAYYIICTAEASSNLARYDGARYGHRAAGVKNLQEMYRKSRSEGFGKEVKRRIMLGTYVLSSGYYDAYYRRAMKARTLIRRDFDAALSRCDLLLTPTTPTTAFKLNEKLRDPVSMYLSDIFTVSANLTGLPAMSVPAGRDEAGLPIGIQLMGRAFDEVTLLRAARFLQTDSPDGHTA